jgi:hypothetical protein
MALGKLNPKKKKFNFINVKNTMLYRENCRIKYACWRLYSEKMTCGGSLPHSLGMWKKVKI